MRDPARIDRVLAALEIYWKRHPDLRLAQIIGNFSPFHDNYHYEDDALLTALEAEIADDQLMTKLDP